MLKTSMLSGVVALRLVIVSRRSTCPDGPPPFTTTAVSTALNPRPSTSFQVMIDVSPV